LVLAGEEGNLEGMATRNHFGEERKGLRAAWDAGSSLTARREADAHRATGPAEMHGALLERVQLERVKVEHGAAAMRPARPGVALALGGGFARGFAHLGVLQVLEQNHIPISHIAGTSVGSILGAAYASGAPLARIMATCRTLKLRDIARWRVSRMGLATNHRLADLIEDVFEARTFEELRIPTAVVATNLNTGEPVVFTEGSLVDPIRASCAFPGIFEPVEIGTRWLVDGALTAQVPTRAAREIGGRNVIGVCVGLHDGPKAAPSNIFQVVSRSVYAAQKHQLELWERHADLVIRPDVASMAWDDFALADQAIEAGRQAALQALPRIQRMAAEAEMEEFRPAHPAEFRDSGLHFITEAIG
jgi:NTE family protein